MRKNIVFQDTPIFYTVVGKGSPVLLLHGFGEDGNIWESQIAYLQAGYQLLVPDLPGSGQSPALPGSPSIETFAEAMAAILAAAQIAACTIMGHSMGGYIALAMAEKYPALFNGLGLLHSTAFADTAAKKETRQKAIEFIGLNGAQVFLKTSIPGLFSSAFAVNSPGVVEDLIKKGDHFTAAALIQYYQAMLLRPDRTAVLQQLQCPLLLVAGVHDNAVPFAQSRQLACLASETHVYFLRNSAHIGMLEETGRFSDALAGFLENLYSKK